MQDGDFKTLGERIKHLQKRKGKGNLGSKGKQRLDKYKTQQYGKRFDQPAGPAPPDAQYTTDVAGAQRDFNFGSAQLAQQQNQLGYETGIGDPSNPYSRSALLEQTYQRNQRGSTNSYAGAGQLYSGALQNASNANTADRAQGQHKIRYDYLQGLAGISNAQQMLGFRQDDANAAALAGNVARASAEPVTDAPPKPGFVKRTQKIAKQGVKDAQKKKQKFKQSRKGGAHGSAYQKKLARLKKKTRKAKNTLSDIPNEYSDEA